MIILKSVHPTNLQFEPSRLACKFPLLFIYLVVFFSVPQKQNYHPEWKKEPKVPTTGDLIMLFPCQICRGQSFYLCVVPETFKFDFFYSGAGKCTFLHLLFVSIV